jgi:hypothetical protein
VWVERPAIVDLAFILPIQEVESRMFYLSKAENSFCLAYILVCNTMKILQSILIFSLFLVQYLSVHLFMAINILAMNFRKALYNQPEAAISKKPFWLCMFSMEGFWYLGYRLTGNSIGTSFVQKQSITKYYKKCWV